MNMKKTLTKHAECRIKQRRIPESLIHETMKRGKKIILPERGAVEYRLNNVLGIRGASLVVVCSNDGSIITTYVDKVVKARRGRR